MPITGCASPAASTGRSSPREPGVWVPGDAAGPRGGSGAEDPTDPSPVPWSPGVFPMIRSLRPQLQVGGDPSSSMDRWTPEPQN
uniref:Uncharacterized protein n=5 Tax=Carnivora TaxID=33554 RepID=A0ABI8A9K9_FELCA